MRTFSIPVGGMTCAGCAAALTQALAAVPGVKRVQVSLAAASAEVTADERVGEAALVAAIERAGFTAAPTRGA
jgi:Cu+-exporting ATPase